MTATYFVITRRAGHESPALYYDRLPDWMLSKRAAAEGLVYALRLDTMPDAAFWLALSLRALAVHYRALASLRKLPPQNLAPPATKQSEPRERNLGEWLAAGARDLGSIRAGLSAAIGAIDRRSAPRTRRGAYDGRRRRSRRRRSRVSSAAA